MSELGEISRFVPRSGYEMDWKHYDANNGKGGWWGPVAIHNESQIKSLSNDEFRKQYMSVEEARAQQRREVIEEFQKAFLNRLATLHQTKRREGIAWIGEHDYRDGDDGYMFADLLEAMFDEWTSADAGTEATT